MKKLLILAVLPLCSCSTIKEVGDAASKYISKKYIVNGQSYDWGKNPVQMVDKKDVKPVYELAPPASE